MSASLVGSEMCIRDRPMCLYVWPTVRTSSPSTVHGMAVAPAVKNVLRLRALKPLPRRATTAAVFRA
eukprot:5268722-Alexandrium_andersonii.AAC.1